MDRVKAGFVGFGCVSYPREVIEKRSEKAREELEKAGLELLYTHPVGTFEEADRAIEDLKKEDFDFLILCIASWIESPIVIRVTDEFRDKPILLWGLGGYTQNGSLVSPASQAGTSGLRWTLEAMGYKFKYIYDFPDSPMSIDKVLAFSKVAKTIKKLRHSKVGMMGYADMGLYGCMFDGMSLRAKIGPEVEVFDMLEIVQKMEKVSPRDVQDLLEEKKKSWNINPDVREEALVNAIRIYLAIRERIKEGSYNAISIKCVEGMKKYMNFPPCMILTMLSEEMPAICEDDALGAVTQLMIHYLTGQPAPYVEMYEFMKDRILVGICGFIPPGAVEGRICVARYAGWGGLSEGAMNVSKMKTGPLTLIRLFSKGDTYKLHMVTGEGLPPRRWEELGWEAPAPFFPSLEIKLDVPIEEFAQKIASQHYFVIYGDHREEIRDLCKVLDIELV
jgi:L-fucose isomerase-like protein